MIVAIAALSWFGGTAVSPGGVARAGAVSADPVDPADPVGPATSVAPSPTTGVSPATTVADTRPPDTTAVVPAGQDDQSESWQPASDQSSDRSEQPVQSVVARSSQSTPDGATTGSTTPPMTTTEDLLIGSPTTRPPETTVAPRDLTGSTVTRTGGSSDPGIWAVVAGLTIVAVGLGVATGVYWRRTRPGIEGDAGDPGDGRRKRRRRSRYADLVVTSPDPQ